MLKMQSVGVEVADLQRLLGIKVTSIYDEATYQAVVKLQKKHGLIADGIAGPKTMLALTSKGEQIKKLLTMRDIQRAAESLQVEAPAVMAVHQVESLGTGFLADGRAKILYERHIMYRQLNKAGIEAALYMQRYPSIVNTGRGGYLGNASEYARLGQAMQINAQCAMESCSWGAYQIMGFHWQHLGYASVQDLVLDMNASEGDQLNAFVKFIQADANLLKALKAKKWADFAKHYNGPAYQENFYDLKLAKAYNDAKANLA